MELQGAKQVASMSMKARSQLHVCRWFRRLFYGVQAPGIDVRDVEV
jgi:hypothetical protein